MERSVLQNIIEDRCFSMWKDLENKKYHAKAKGLIPISFILLNLWYYRHIPIKIYVYMYKLKYCLWWQDRSRTVLGIVYFPKYELKS